MKWIFLHTIVFLFSISTVFCQKKNAAPQILNKDSIEPVGIIKNISDSELLDIVQRQTFRFFWHGAHPNSGMALERNNTVHAEFYWDYLNEWNGEPNLSKSTFGPDACAVGGTGMGILATIVAVNRGWIGRDTAVGRLIRIADFLTHADCYHGIFPHFINGKTGKVVPFGRIDDGADIVETSYLMMGFLAAREYFNNHSDKERYLRNRITDMWDNANWNWHTKNDGNLLYWHWSSNNDFDMNFPVWGYDEALTTYIISASSPYHPISKKVYDSCWVKSTSWKNGKQYYGYTLPLGNYEKGGPLFFEQYSYMGFDPHSLTDEFGNSYWEQCKNHTLINRAYCIENPKHYKGYGENCWGLTAGDSYMGYVAHCPEVDSGVIQPTASLSSFPYTPEYSMQVLKHLYYDLGNKVWGEYGFVDGFSETHNWYAHAQLAIDQGPIVVMIENYRTGLLWKLFMNIPDIQNGLKKLGFESPYIKK
jgi:hypothetical protein